ncbi:pectin lyase-like protein [Serendipita vermifera]|nr:pectin lyase-like protein [Serendipita vermifera]
MRPIYSLAAFAATIISTVNAQQSNYGQCGGIGWTGLTTCNDGWQCVVQNDWYSQCVPATTTASSTSTRTSTTTTSTRSSTTTTSTRTSTTTTSTRTSTTTTTTAGASTGIPSGAITVGSGGKYSTLSAALQDTSSNVYYIYAGTYTGQVAISRSNIKIYGQTSDSSSYTGNKVTLTDNIPASSAGSNDASGTVRILATGVKLYNLNIANTYGKPVDQSQAIALSVQAGQFGCYGCQISGTQDTLLANVGTQVYAKCLISGYVDFIFGQTASIWITKSVIQTTGSGYITASGRSSDDANYYVIDNSTIQGSGTSYLGRPWRNYARVIFQNSVLGSNVKAAGWSVWSSSDTRTDHILFGEYNNSGSGAWSSSRASFATQLSSAVSISTVLGSSYTSWVDTTYL